MVLQDTWLFTGTIFANIKYGREDAGDEEVYRAARLARADNFIRQLPDGYETLLNANFPGFYNSSHTADRFSASRISFMHDFPEMRGSLL